MSLTLPLRTTATAACRLCPIFRHAVAKRSAGTRPQVAIGGAVLGSLVVGTSFWLVLAYVVAKTLF